MAQPPQLSQPLARVASLKVKLGLLVAASVVVAAVVASVGRASGVPWWLGLPVTVLLALALTQLLAVGMTSPLRQMTAAARRMATGDYAVRVSETASDEVGELARAFNTMARDLADVDRQRRELVANVSHELRTPLAGLAAVLENLVDGVGPRDPESLRVALDQAERMNRLVEDLLDLARVDAGRAPLTPEQVPLASLLADAVAEADAPGPTVTFDVDTAPPDLVVRADPARLRQLVANLLDNASRHSPAGGTVRVTATRLHQGWRLEVHDQGPGVTAEDRERVFEPFGTLGDTGGGGGTGLGLAIARWVTDLHGGTIRFVGPDPDPDPGVGAGTAGDPPAVAVPSGGRVRVDLPAAPPDRPDQQEDRVPTSPHPAPASAQEPGVPPADVPARPLVDELFGGFWPDRGVPARLGVLLGAVATGVLGGLLLPHDIGLGWFLVLLAAGGVVLAASRHRRTPYTLTCAGLALLLVTTTVVRDADWIVLLCLLAGAGLGLLGATHARTLPGFLLTGLCWPLAGLRGLPWLGRTLAVVPGRGHPAALLRTIVWSVVALLVFGALFVSADALLADWAGALLPDLRTDVIVQRGFLTVAVTGAVLAAAYLALDPARVDRVGAGPAAPVGRRFEWLVPVLVVNAAFAAFLLAQVTVVLAGHDYLQRTIGLTYAEYVHQGFGQLIVATALTLLVVGVAARKAPRDSTADRAWLRGSLGLLCLQTLLVVGSALQRMHLYQEAYGLTRLRLLVDVFEGWLGLLVLAVLVGGVALRAAWLPRFALFSGAVALLGLAAINPDALIAEQNLQRYAETGKVDLSYLSGLSDDAAPVIAELPDVEQRCVFGYRPAPSADLLEWNLGSARAAEVLASVEVRDDRPPSCPE